MLGVRGDGGSPNNKKSVVETLFIAESVGGLLSTRRFFRRDYFFLNQMKFACCRALDANFKLSPIGDARKAFLKLTHIIVQCSLNQMKSVHSFVQTSDIKSSPVSAFNLEKKVEGSIMFIRFRKI